MFSENFVDVHGTFRTLQVPPGWLFRLLWKVELITPLCAGWTSAHGGAEESPLFAGWTSAPQLHPFGLGWVELGGVGLGWVGLNWVGLDWVGFGFD